MSEAPKVKSRPFNNVKAKPNIDTSSLFHSLYIESANHYRDDRDIQQQSPNANAELHSSPQHTASKFQFTGLFVDRFRPFDTIEPENRGEE